MTFPGSWMQLIEGRVESVLVKVSHSIGASDYLFNDGSNCWMYPSAESEERKHWISPKLDVAIDHWMNLINILSLQQNPSKTLAPISLPKSRVPKFRYICRMPVVIMINIEEIRVKWRQNFLCTFAWHHLSEWITLALECSRVSPSISRSPPRSLRMWVFSFMF